MKRVFLLLVMGLLLSTFAHAQQTDSQTFEINIAVHSISLDWTDSGTPGVIGYYIYRGTAPGGEGALPLNQIPMDAHTFVDINVLPGVTYYYVVTAVAADGVTQSVPSNEVHATVPSP